jgi:hypothetical protein
MDNQDGIINFNNNCNINIDITGNILGNITQFKNEEVNKEELNMNILFTLLLLKQEQHETFNDFYLPISQVSYSQESNFYISNSVNRGNNSNGNGGSSSNKYNNTFNNDDVNLDLIDITINSDSGYNNNNSYTSSDYKNNTTSYSNSIHNNTLGGICGNSEHIISFYQNPLNISPSYDDICIPTTTTTSDSKGDNTGKGDNTTNNTNTHSASTQSLSFNLISLLNTCDIIDNTPIISPNSACPKGTTITSEEPQQPESLNITINKQKLAKVGKSYYLYQKQLDFYLTNIGKDYLNLMMEHYNNIQSQISDLFDAQMCKNLFIKLFKSFLLELGISHKQFYQEILRHIAFQREMISFGDFIQSFNPILELKLNAGVIKMRFLLFIFQIDNKNDYLTLREVNIFFIMIKRKLPYEEEITEEICDDLIRRYEVIFFNEEKNNLLKGRYNVKKLATVLETFYNNNME